MQVYLEDPLLLFLLLLTCPIGLRATHDAQWSYSENPNNCEAILQGGVSWLLWWIWKSTETVLTGEKLLANKTTYHATTRRNLVALFVT